MACSCSGGSKISLELMEIIQHDNETYSFDFNMNQDIMWKEGDSSKVYVQVGEQQIGKKFSYATVPEENKIRFTTRIREEASRYKQALNALKIGDSIEVSEPSGEFYLRRENRPILLLSNGVGVAASRSLIYAYQYDQSDIPMMASINVNNSSKLYETELKEVESKIKYFSAHHASDRKNYYQSVDFVLQNIMKYLSDDPIIYVVGSHAFVQGSIEHLLSMGMSGHDIITDGPISTDGGCGCGDEAACGCGGNEVLYLYPDNLQLPVVKL